MSLSIFKLFRHLCRVQGSTKDLRIVNRLCIHCTSQHRQDDRKSGVPNVVGPPETLKSIKKEDMISRAMQTYLERKQKSDALREKNAAEYDLGRHHLANIMGIDEDELTTEKVREAIQYLLPSGLFNKMARPLMEHPSFFLPPSKGQEFNTEGRPTHFLFYTAKPAYYELMHDMAWKYTQLQSLNFDPRAKDAEKTEFGLDWTSFEDFKNMFPAEKISEHDYNRFRVLIQRLADHPLADKENKFLEKYRVRLRPESLMGKVPEPTKDVDGREFVIRKAKRKTSMAKVKMIHVGSGQININGQDITYFSEVIHRQAILSPLQLCGLIDKFDIVAQVSGTGPSANAGALRLAISKGLLSFIPEDMQETLRIAGYLTADPRRKERKKPGQEKARKKFTWKRR